MNWLSLLKLIPIIAAGVQQVHSDLDGAGKVAAAQDALAFATAGAQSVLTGSAQTEATAFGALASQSLSSAVLLLHQSGTPATAPASSTNTSSNTPSTSSVETETGASEQA